MATFTSRVTRAGGFLVREANGFRSREQITMLSGQAALLAGAVLGRVLSGAAGAAVADAGNTGNGVMGAITVTGAEQGAYRLVVENAATNAGEFVIENPEGVEIGRGNVASAFSGGGLAFTLADGSTDFAEGDAFTINVTGGGYKYKEYNPANTDGSQRVAGVLWDDVDASAGDVICAVVARDCEVNQGELSWFSGATSGQKAVGIAQLADLGIIARPSVPA